MGYELTVTPSLWLASRQTNRDSSRRRARHRGLHVHGRVHHRQRAPITALARWTPGVEDVSPEVGGSGFIQRAKLQPVTLKHVPSGPVFS